MITTYCYQVLIVKVTGRILVRQVLNEGFRNNFKIPSVILNVLGCVGMRWLRLVGSFKLQVSFAEHSLFYRAILQKRPIILRRLLVKATQ